MSEEIQDQTLWRGALIPALIVALVFTAGSVVLKQTPGLWGALLASFTVIIFFSVHLIVAAVTKNLDPMATMALAMFSYFAKVLLMGVFLLLVTRFTAPETVNRAAFAASALSITAAWLGGEIRAFLKLRVALPLPSAEK